MDYSDFYRKNKIEKEKIVMMTFIGCYYIQELQ